MQVRGFGAGLARSVVDWKVSCERRFKFNPATAVSPADREAVRAKYAKKRIALEQALLAAPVQLQQFRQNGAARLASLQPELEVAARKLAQAQADLSKLE